MSIVNELPNQENVEEIILSRVSENPEREVCGFLLTDGTSIIEIFAGVGTFSSSVMPLRLPLDTVSAKCCSTELVKRGVKVQEMQPCQSGMPFLVCYHSHPNGDVIPSNQDVKKYFLSSYLLGMILLNFGKGLNKIRCYEVICSPEGDFNWWSVRKVGS